MALRRREIEAHVEVFGVDLPLANLERAMDRPVGVDRLGRQLELAVGDARDVEQIVDQPRLELDVAPDDLERVARGGRVHHPVQLGDHGDDRREGVAQLMGEQRQELVLGGIGGDEVPPGLDIVGGIFHQQQDAVCALLGVLKLHQVDREEMRPLRGILDGLLARLERAATAGDPREGLVDPKVRQVPQVQPIGRAVRGRAAEFARHLEEFPIRLEHLSRPGVQQGDADGHMGEDRLAERGLPGDALGGEQVIAVEPAHQP